MKCFNCGNECSMIVRVPGIGKKNCCRACYDQSWQTGKCFNVSVIWYPKEVKKNESKR
jgi:hypothetical protein